MRTRRRKVIRKTRKIRKQKGGDYIAEGTYGCVFGNPALRCKGEATAQEGIITKLLTVHEANKEFKQYEILHDIDPEQHFLLYPLEKPCTPATPSEVERTWIKSCKKYIKDSLIVKYKYGGVNIDNIKIEVRELKEFLEGYLALMRGVSSMHKKGHFHCDIKPENVLANREDSIKIRLVDFGLMQVLTPTYKPPPVMDSNYAFWPFSAHLLFEGNYNKLFDFRDSIDVEYKLGIDRYIISYIPRDIFYKDGQFIILETPAQMVEIFNGLPKDPIERYRVLLTAIDMYGLGATLGKTLYGFFGENLILKDFYNVIRKLMTIDPRALPTLDACILDFHDALDELADAVEEWD